VIENQIKKFPILYLENVINTVSRVIITGTYTFNAFVHIYLTSTLYYVGFCIGGVLAQMLTARLWLLPQTTDMDHLMSSVVCITFGQPMVQSEMLSHVAEIFPDFRNNVHAIELVDDNSPSILERLDSLASTTEVKE
jgi:hypothetical protein